MSSKKDPDPVASVTQLGLKRKIKKKVTDPTEPFRRTVRSDHGYPTITLPKFLLGLGLKLNAEVVIERRGEPNPLNWEIVIKPARSKSKVQKKHSVKVEQ